MIFSAPIIDWDALWGAPGSRQYAQTVTTLQGDGRFVSAARRDELNRQYGDDVAFVRNPNAGLSSDRAWFGPYWTWDATDRAILDKLGIAYRTQQRFNREATTRFIGDAAKETVRGAAQLWGDAAGKGVEGLGKALGLDKKTLVIGGAALLALVLLK